jgi:FMN-dependent NADH-azoreductase
VVHHNTTAEKLPFLDAAMVEAFFRPEAERSAEQRRLLELSDRLVDELLECDVLVVAAPMWNLSVPASLKAWIDLMVRPGRVFEVTAEGVRSLVPAGKRVFVFTSRGGDYGAGSKIKAMDFEEPYLRALFGSLGMSDVEFVNAEEQYHEGEVARLALERAEARMMELLEGR